MVIELGGNIKLSGFNDLDQPSLIIVKKIVGNYAKKIGEQATQFSELALVLQNAQEKFDLQVTLAADKKNVNASATDKNLFFALDKALESVFNEAKK